MDGDDSNNLAGVVTTQVFTFLNRLQTPPVSIPTTSSSSSTTNGITGIGTNIILPTTTSTTTGKKPIVVSNTTTTTNTDDLIDIKQQETELIPTNTNDTSSTTSTTTELITFDPFSNDQNNTTTPDVLHQQNNNGLHSQLHDLNFSLSTSPNHNITSINNNTNNNKPILLSTLTNEIPTTSVVTSEQSLSPPPPITKKSPPPLLTNKKSPNTNITPLILTHLPLPIKKRLTYDDFITKLKNPQSADLVKRIKSFVYSLLNSSENTTTTNNNNSNNNNKRIAITSNNNNNILPPNDPEQLPRLVSTFMGEIRQYMLNSSFWNNSNSTNNNNNNGNTTTTTNEEELENSFEGLERFIMIKIYSKTFSPTVEYKIQDDQLNLKIRQLQQFVTCTTLDLSKHLDDEMLYPAWKLVMEELNKINTYKAPLDKIICILNCCHVLGDIIKNPETGKEGSADEFLPALIYAIIKSNPAKLYSNVDYITQYRDLRGKEGYLMTQFASAVQFISNATFKYFTGISEEIFMEAEQKVKNNEPQKLVSTPLKVVEQQPQPQQQFSTWLLSRGIERDSWFHARFIHRDVQDIGQLRISDVGILLENYKLLVDACEVLLKERDENQLMVGGTSSTSTSMSTSTTTSSS
jgi:hypothetical protein